MGESKRRQQSGNTSPKTIRIQQWVISRIEIETLQTAAVETHAMNLMKEGATAIRLSIDGYNSDSRELWEIPEVKRFFRIVTQNCPIVTILNTSSVRLLMSFVLGAVAETDKIGKFLYSQFDALNQFITTEAECVKFSTIIADKIVRAYSLDMSTQETAFAAFMAE